MPESGGASPAAKNTARLASNGRPGDGAISRRGAPAAWAEPLPWAMLPAASALILVHGAARDDPEALGAAGFWAALSVGLFVSLLVLVPNLFVPFQQKVKPAGWLSSEVVTCRPPFLSCQPPPDRPGPAHAFGLGGTSFMRSLTRGVRFEPDGVTILAQRLYGLFPMHFRIPARDPEIRARIRAWAEERRIPPEHRGGLAP